MTRKHREEELDQIERQELASKKRDAYKNRTEMQIHNAINARLKTQQRKSISQKTKETQQTSQNKRDSRLMFGRIPANFKSVAQFWDQEHPCIHCGAEWLRSVTKNGRSKCCHGDKVFLESSNFPHLQPLPDRLKCLLLYRTRHMSPNSAIYNNMFSFARVSVDNHRGNKFEEIRGSSGVKINGLVYSYLPRAYDTPTMSDEY